MVEDGLGAFDCKCSNEQSTEVPVKATQSDPFDCTEQGFWCELKNKLKVVTRAIVLPKNNFWEGLFLCL